MKKTIHLLMLFFLLAIAMLAACGSDNSADNNSAEAGHPGDDDDATPDDDTPSDDDSTDDDATPDDDTPSDDDATDDDATDDDSTDDDATDDDTTDDDATDDDEVALEGLGGLCAAVHTADGKWLAAASETTFAFVSDANAAAHFYLQPSDLTTYLFYDAEQAYFLSDSGPLLRAKVLESDVTRVEDDYISGAEWILEPYEGSPSHYQFRNRRNDALLGPLGLGGVPVALSLEPVDGCATYPEMSLDATGTITRTTFDDGTLYGIADAHEHLLTNFSFGGGLFHGGTYHRLGVTHALGDCSVVHGENGRKDFLGYVWDSLGLDPSTVLSLAVAFLLGELPVDNHATAGWPEFTDWPDAPHRSTHQAMYYRWLERAWMAGLRLLVTHATSDFVICSLMVGGGIEPSRYDCEDMTSVDRIIDEAWAMQRYIDAQAGGEGLGWFRIVRSPAEAREVIAAGKLAVVLGIETSSPFRCRLSPRPGDPVCDEAWIDEQLDAYYARGIRAVFPVHKYDNRFSPGDGNRGFLEGGNFFNSGHWTNMTQDCPTDGQNRGWDNGGIFFGGLQQPRDEYLSDPPVDMSGFGENPVPLVLRYMFRFLQPSISGDWCQNATITAYGEALLAGMMARGMIIEVDHFPSWSYRRAYELLEEYDYPAAATHGRVWDGRPYTLGGIATIGLGRCQDPDDPGSTVRGLTDRVALIESLGGYPGAGFGFDLNGFAGAPGGRFAAGACAKEQPNPIAYPFSSYAGDVEFTAPFLGNRAVDFNTEGLVDIGLLPELIQDVRADAGDAALEPLFRSAEAYLRMWEKAEQRAAELRDIFPRQGRR